MAELVLCSGFFLVYLVEEVVQLLVHPDAHHDNLNSYQSSKAVDKAQGRDGERANSCCDATNHNDMEMQPRSESSTSESSIDPGYNPKYSVRLSLSTSSVFPNYHSPDSLKPSPQEKTSPSHSRLFLFLAKPSLLRNLYLVLAFSFLAAFDGLLIGLEDSSENIWKILTVIASHKLIITFCLSLELLQATSSNIGFGLFLLIFSLVSPLGVGVGLTVSAEPTEDHQVIVAVLQGLAGGTIVYLVMFELVQREMGKKVAGLLQLVGISLTST